MEHCDKCKWTKLAPRAYILPRLFSVKHTAKKVLKILQYIDDLILTTFTSYFLYHISFLENPSKICMK